MRCCTAVLVLLVVASINVKAQVGRTKGRVSKVSAHQVVRLLLRSTVLIITQDADGEPLSQASGFFIRPDVVVTNLHTFKWASQAHVKPVGLNISLKVRDIIGFDVKHDLCLVKLDLAEGTPLTLGNSDRVSVGDDIFVAGNPKGLEGSISKGIVSGIRNEEGLLQIDAAISPGSSGGPVVNTSGEVIGIATSSFVGGQNLNFAVPVKLLASAERGVVLSVKGVGALSLSDAEYAHLRGQIRSVSEWRASYRYDRMQDTYVKGPAEPQIVRRYNREGNLVDTQAIGVELEEHIKYEDNGLPTAVESVFKGSRNSKSYSLEEAIKEAGSRRTYSFENELKSDTGTVVWMNKYDQSGNIVESIQPNNVRVQSHFDPAGRETEWHEYEKGSLVRSFRASHDLDEHGNWIRRVVSWWDAAYPTLGYSPYWEDTREIVYY